MQKHYAPPIPRDQFAKMIDRSLAWVRVLIHQGRLPALELVQDKKTLESILMPYTSGDAKPQSLFIDPSLAASCQKMMRTREDRPKGVKGPRGKFLTDEELDTIFKRRYDTSHILVPVPLSHLSKRVGLTIPTLCAAIKEGSLQAVEFMLDASNTSKLVLHNPRPMRGNALYVLPDEARRFIAEEQSKRDEIQSGLTNIPTGKANKKYSRIGNPPVVKASEGNLVPFNNQRIGDIPLPEEGLEDNILEIARQLKEQSGGTVERIKILEALSGGKRNNMYLYKRIKYVMDQHLDEFPPHRSGPHAFLTKKATKGK
jgi:hypothetical protein